MTRRSHAYRVERPTTAQIVLALLGLLAASVVAVAALWIVLVAFLLAFSQ